MSSSQDSVSTTPSKVMNESELRTYVQEQALEAQNLERELAEAVARHHESKANQKRVPLCKVLADWLLTSPATALQHDVLFRLWRTCFYSRISRYRNTILKEERKAQKAGISPEAATQKLEESLQAFLVEGITLYEYLIDRLAFKLAERFSSSSSSVSSSTVRPQADAAATEASTTTEGVVPALVTCYIQLGDLFRYAKNQMPRAEAAYAKAARLGPGQGHPYNQLAVVCQVKDMAGDAPLSAVAFYWYCRALGALDEVFLTALTNLTRLLTSNRAWLQQQREQQQQDHQTPNVRIFLAGFCDLQYTIMTGIAPTEHYLNPTIVVMDLTLDLFESLLNTSALGDSLLIKLVTIAAFCEGYTQSNLARAAARKKEQDGGDGVVKSKNDDHEEDQKIALTAAVGRTLLLRMGQLLGKRWLASHEKSKSSVRGLAPLAVLTDYCSTAPLVSNPTSATSCTTVPALCENLYQAALDSFGQVLVSVLNRLTAAGHKSCAATTSGTTTALPKEYNALYGFAPFSFLPPRGYLSAQEAAVVFEESRATTTMQASQESASVANQSIHTATSSSNNNSNAQEGGRLKAGRLLEIGGRLVETTSTTSQELDLAKHVGFDTKEGLYKWTSVFSPEEDEHMDEDDQIPMDETEEDSDPTQAPDVLVYQPNKEGGPPLLVPGAFLQQNVSPGVAPPQPTVAPPQPVVTLPPLPLAVPRIDPTPPSVHSTAEPEGQQMNSVIMDLLPSLPTSNGFGGGSSTTPMEQSPPVLLPPPGFGPPAGASAPVVVAAASMTASTTAPNPMFPPGMQQMGTVGESFHFFGGLASLHQTANPFASLPESRGIMPTAPQPASDLMLEDDVHGMDGASFLDSSLLNSLMAEDTPQKTKNPFATTY